MQSSGWFKVFTSLHDEMYDGSVWLPQSQKVASRQVVRLKNKRTGRMAWCEAKELDNEYVSRYNEDCSEGDLRLEVNGHNVVIPKWHRTKLGIRESRDTGFPESSYLDVDRRSYFGLYRLFACLTHPQNAVRLATWLALLSLALGGLSLVVGWSERLLYCIVVIVIGGLLRWYTYQ